MKTIKIIINLFILLLYQSAFAEEDYLKMANEAKNNLPQQIAIYQKDANLAIEAQKNIPTIYRQDALLAKKTAQEILLKNLSIPKSDTDKNKKSSILIFVSFSIPRESLIAYLHDAKKVHAAVIIRGLIDNSFQKTFQQVANLVKASDGEGVQLNPILFKNFSIKSVPAIVIGDEVVYGDVPLSYAIKIINERSHDKNTNEVAELAFQKLKDSQNE
jgi:type-F conjugative transfer system pilin assembly protein TrbC